MGRGSRNGRLTFGADDKLVLDAAYTVDGRGELRGAITRRRRRRGSAQRDPAVDRIDIDAQRAQFLVTGQLGVYRRSDGRIVDCVLRVSSSVLHVALGLGGSLLHVVLRAVNLLLSARH